MLGVGGLYFRGKTVSKAYTLRCDVAMLRYVIPGRVAVVALREMFSFRGLCSDAMSLYCDILVCGWGMWFGESAFLGEIRFMGL